MSQEQSVLQDNVPHQDEPAPIPIKQSGSSGIAALLRTTKDAGILKRIAATKNGGSMTDIDSSSTNDNGSGDSHMTKPGHRVKVHRIQSVPCDVPLSSHTPSGRTPLNSVPSVSYAIKTGSTSSASSYSEHGTVTSVKKQPLLPPSTRGYQNGRQSSTSKLSSSGFSSVSDQSELSHDFKEESPDFKEISPDRASQESQLSDCFIEEEDDRDIQQQFEDSSSSDQSGQYNPHQSLQFESDDSPLEQEDQQDDDSLEDNNNPSTHRKSFDSNSTTASTGIVTPSSTPPSVRGASTSSVDGKKRPLYPPGKSPPTGPRPPPLAKSVSINDASRQDSASVSVVTATPVKPVPKPRLQKASTSSDLYTKNRSTSSSSISDKATNRDLPSDINVTMTTDSADDATNADKQEGVKNSRGISPPARDLKLENEILKQQILRLKEQQSKLKNENVQLKEHLQVKVGGEEVDTPPTNQGRSNGSVDSDGRTENLSNSFSNSKPHSVTVQPRPRSRSVSPIDVQESNQSDLRRSLDDIILPSSTTSRPVPIPRERGTGFKSTAAISSSVPTKTFMARSRDVTPPHVTTPTTTTTGPSYSNQRGAEKASSVNVGSQSPIPKPRLLATTKLGGSIPVSRVSKSPSPINVNEGVESPVTTTTAVSGKGTTVLGRGLKRETSSPGDDLKTPSNNDEKDGPAVTVGREKIMAVHMLQKLIPKQPHPLPVSTSPSHVQAPPPPQGTKPVPVRKVVVVAQKDTPPVAVSNGSGVDCVDGSKFVKKTTEVKVQPTRNLTPSKPPPPPAPVSSTVTNKSLTPPKPPASSVGEGVNNDTSPKPVRGVLYKKMAIKSDVSWIKGGNPTTSNDTTDSAPSKLAPPTTTPSPKMKTSASVGAISPPKKPAPYRSHAILSGSSTTSTSILNPGAAYSTPKPTAGGSPRMVAKETKVPPPRIVSNRKRTETISGSRKEADSRGSDKRRHSFTSSTSDDSISSAASEGRSSKVKGFLGKKTQSEAKVLAPKKPPRPWLGGKGRGYGDEFGGRPASMMDTTPSNSRVAAFTSSCIVSTVPRGTDPDEMKDQKSQSPRRRKKQASDSSLLENGSPKNPRRFGLFKTKQKQHHNNLAPPLEEEGDLSDSSSDDEKGGTIKYKPQLRHVSVKKTLSRDDDDEADYNQLFEYVFVVGLKEVSKGKLTTEMTYTFPPATCPFSGKDAALQSIPQFCFPDLEQWKPTKSYHSESFSFVLTDMEGNRRFGYCRRLLPDGTKSRLPECYCIVSPLGCFSLYENILDHVERRRAVSSMAVFTFLKAIVANPFPRPGRSVQVRAFSANGKGLETLEFGRPMDSRLEHVSFALLFSTLSQRKVIKLFSSLLMERRVIFCAHSLSLLSGCAHALMALLYPFEWQHVFIPVLPSSLIDFVCSPLPYIIGISPACIKQIDVMETMEEAVIIDLDKKKFIRQIGDEASILPSKLFQYLEHALSSSVISSEYSKKSSSKKAAATSRADELVVNTFMKFFAYLYGDYKAHMKTLNPATGVKEFQRSEFIHKFSSKSTRRFLEAFHLTQMFEEFIEQRENPNKAETTAQSLFERKLPEFKERCQEIEIFSSKSRFDRWKIKKGLAKK